MPEKVEATFQFCVADLLGPKARAKGIRCGCLRCLASYLAGADAAQSSEQNESLLDGKKAAAHDVES